MKRGGYVIGSLCCAPAHCWLAVPLNKRKDICSVSCLQHSMVYSTSKDILVYQTSCSAVTGMALLN